MNDDNNVDITLKSFVASFTIHIQLGTQRVPN